MHNLASEFKAATRGHKALLLLFFLAPALAFSTRGGASAAFTLALLPALYLAWPMWRQLQPHERTFLTGFILLFLAGCVSLFFTSDLAEGGNKLERFLRLMLLVPIYMMLRRLRLEVGGFILAGTLIAVLVMFGQSLYEVFVLGKPEPEGPYYEIAFSAFGVLSASIAAAAALSIARGGWQIAGYSLIALLALYVSYLTGGRGGWLAIPVVVLLFMWMMRRRLNVKITLTASALIVLALAALIATNPETLQKRVGSAVLQIETFMEDPSQTNSVGNRLNMWRDSFIIWTRNPVFGTGWGDFTHDSEALIEEGIAYHPKLRYTEAHSIYFDALAMTGLVGLVAMLWGLILAPLRLFLRTWAESEDDWARFYALAGGATITVFAVVGLTESWFARNMFVGSYILFVVAFSSSLYARRQRADSHR